MPWCIGRGERGPERDRRCPALPLGSGAVPAGGLILVCTSGSPSDASLPRVHPRHRRRGAGLHRSRRCAGWPVSQALGATAKSCHAVLQHSGPRRWVQLWHGRPIESQARKMGCVEPGNYEEAERTSRRRLGAIRQSILSGSRLGPCPQLFAFRRIYRFCGVGHQCSFPKGGCPRRGPSVRFVTTRECRSAIPAPTARPTRADLAAG